MLLGLDAARYGQQLLAALLDFPVQLFHFFGRAQELHPHLFKGFVGDEGIGDLHQIAGGQGAALDLFSHADDFLDDQRRP